MEWLLLWLLLSILVAVYWSRKGRSGVVGFIVSLIISPLIGFLIGLVLEANTDKIDKEKLLSGKMRKCPFCAELVKADACVCRYCHSELPSEAPTTDILGDVSRKGNMDAEIHTKGRFNSNLFRIVLVSLSVMVLVLMIYVVVKQVHTDSHNEFENKQNEMRQTQTGVLGNEALATDACRALIPSDLQELLLKRFPDYRLPLTSDTLADFAEGNVKNSSGCPGIVASGDVDGDNRLDYALILKVNSTSIVKVVAALNHSDGWRIYSLGEGDYVTTLKPGSYDRTPALEGPASESGEVLYVSSKYLGFETGTYEASSVAYFFQDNHWVHVWLSD